MLAKAPHNISITRNDEIKAKKKSWKKKPEKKSTASRGRQKIVVDEIKKK